MLSVKSQKLIMIGMGLLRPFVRIGSVTKRCGLNVAKNNGFATSTCRIDAGEKKSETKGARMTKKNIKGSQFKLNLLAKQIAGKTVNDALTQMKFSKKRRGTIVAATINTACNMANIFHGLDKDNLYIAEAITGRGSYSNRPFYRARGNFDFIKKTSSHLTVIVKEDNRDLSYKRRGKNPRRMKNRRRPGEQ